MDTLAYKEHCQRLITCYQHPEAGDPSPTAADSMGLASTNREEQSRLIGLVIDSDYELFSKDAYEWALNPASFESVADAHLTYLALWGLKTIVGKRKPKDRAGVMATISVHIIRSRNLSPFMVRGNGINSIIFPNSFFKMLDNFYQAYLVGVRQGRTDEVTGKTLHANSGIVTDHVGGLSAWRALKADYASCRHWINQLIQHMVFNEALPDHMQLMSDSVLWEMATKVLDMLGYGVSKRSQMQQGKAPIEQVTSAVYLTVVFALLHEVAHVALDLVLQDDRRDKSGYGSGPVESLVDSMAYRAYFDYIDKVIDDKSCPIYFPDNITAHMFGPASFFMAILCRYRVGQLFVGLTNDNATTTPEYQSVIQRRREVVARRNYLIDIVAHTASQREMLPEYRNQLLQALMEFYVMEKAIIEFFKPKHKVDIGPIGA